jgi:hypothetical protein
MIIALTLLGALLASTTTGSERLTGKMAIYNDLLGARWTCTLGTATYFAAYTAARGNTLHGHLYSKDQTEDEYFGYDAQRKLYWISSADSTGATESQTSVDGMTFVGTLNDGRTTTRATNIYTIHGAHKWVVHARGSAGGHAYDVTATCLRD